MKREKTMGTAAPLILKGVMKRLVQVVQDGLNSPHCVSVHHILLISAMKTMAVLMKFSVVLMVVLWIFVASTNSGKL